MGLFLIWDVADDAHALREIHAIRGKDADPDEPYGDLIRAYCAVPLKIQYRSYRSMLAMMDDNQAS